LIKEAPEPPVLDAGLISAAQHVEHYEIAGYGSVRTWAEQLGYPEHARLLQETLEEERKADQLLTQLAVRSINMKADTGEGARPRPAARSQRVESERFRRSDVDR
jgi:ferritin-like metal-binding protein YciE